MIERADWPVVALNDDGIRPGGPADECFYCRQKVGQPHGSDCVCVLKLVRVMYSIEVDVLVPHNWTAEDFERHRNETGWCSNNALDEIEEQSNAVEEAGACMCDRTTATFVAVLDDTPRRALRDAEGIANDAKMREHVRGEKEREH